MSTSRRWLFIGFGLLPLWVATIFVTFLIIDNPSNMIAAPWLIFAAVPLSGITLAIAGISNAVYARTRGDRLRKFVRAAGAFCLLIIAAVIAAAIFLRR